MALQRRFLPPTALLTAFEAAARHQSVSAAARELHLTQSAVSRQIRSLEEMLGSTLFDRQKQTIRLTVAGSAYAREIREALARVANATLNFRANPNGGSLNLAILPTFGTRWLAPRLPEFLAAHPGITVNLSTRSAPFDFRLENLHAAIHFGPAEWPGASLDFLMAEVAVPTCSPSLRDRYDFRLPNDLLDAPLLHITTRPDAWERWFEAQNVVAGQVHGMLVDQFAMAAQAASAGLGVALLPMILVASELARGELVLALDAMVTSEDAYYLARPDTQECFPPLEQFRAWLIAEARASAESGQADQPVRDSTIIG